MIVLISQDLMFGSQVAEVCRAEEKRLLRVKGDHAMFAVDPADRERPEDPISLVILDLSCQGKHLADLTKWYRHSDHPPQMVAFGPHVDRQALADAAQAGFAVLTRGQFHAHLPSLIAGEL